jgi:putative transposase
MPMKTFTPEQIVGKLRQIEVLVGQGKTVPLACKESGVTAQTFYRWRISQGLRFNSMRTSG